MLVKYIKLSTNKEPMIELIIMLQYKLLLQIKYYLLICFYNLFI